MAVLIIFPAILQTVINLIMLSIGGQQRLGQFFYATEYRRIDRRSAKHLLLPYKYGYYYKGTKT